MNNTVKGMWLGLIGVVIFSLTLPMTRVAMQSLDPVFLALGRAVTAAVPAALALWLTKSRLPTRTEWKHVWLAAIGIVLGWPLMSSLSMKYVPAAHGALINGLLPLATAFIATRLHGERPSTMFWLLALIGSGLVTGYMLVQGKGSLQLGDGLMLCAVVLGGLGYASGAEAARTLGAWQTICWALVISAPIFVIPAGLMFGHSNTAAITPTAWWAFAYLALMSQFVGFFAWYGGLARGGTARVGQVQLLQMFMTVSWAHVFFGEHVPWHTWIFACAIVLLLYFVRRVPMTQPNTAKVKPA
jgi:drug/metabolite transporter (DMT)-like permease